MSIIARTDKEIEAYKLFTTFINSMTKLDDFLKANRVDQVFLIKLHPVQIGRWFIIEDGSYKINPQVFRRLKKQLAAQEPVESL